MKTSDLIRKLNKPTKIKPDIIKIIPEVRTIEVKSGELTEEVITKEINKIINEEHTEETVLLTTNNTHTVDPVIEPEIVSVTLTQKLDNIFKQMGRLSILVNEQVLMTREINDKISCIEKKLTSTFGLRNLVKRIFRKWL